MKPALYAMLFILFSSIPLMSQISIKAVSLPVGESSFSGNSPSTNGFYLDPSVDISIPSFSALTFRPHVMLMKDFNAIFPSVNSNSYSPALYGYGLEVIETQPFTSAITMEFGGGVLALKDRTYSDINTWAYGVDVTAALRVNVYSTPAGGLFLGLGGSYGQTFSDTNPAYFAVFAQLRYAFSE
jgi:hypothetical protein